MPGLAGNFGAAPPGTEPGAPQAADEDYWTPERIAGAAPFPMAPRAEADALPPDATIDLEALLRGAGRRARVQSRPPNETSTAEFTAPAAVPYDTARVPNRGQFPYSAVGKLLARVNGADFAGSAWVVGERSIVTAGHCVLDPGSRRWVSHVAFLPQFDSQPVKGVWPASSIHTLAGWAAGGPQAAAFDLGSAILAQPVAPVTGRIGWRANIAPNQGLLHAVGYPADWLSAQFDFDGKHMWSCNGGYAGGSAVIGMHNNMTRGSSGGPWLVKDQQGRIFACGLNSTYADNNQALMYSPYFGQGIINLIHVIG
ncbi:trypsin-like serine peptidase [Novosphingobium sp. 11B]